MSIADGGRTQKNITPANHALLFDSAYARQAAKAVNQAISVCKASGKEFGPTAKRDRAQYLRDDLCPHYSPTTEIEEGGEHESTLTRLTVANYLCIN